MERKLASIQIVHDVVPIKDADKIELIKVLGWQCVAKKGEFKKGDKCIYFEIDSFLPICDKFEFLRKSSYKKSEILGEGFRLKTIRLRGVLSQGLVMPLSILPSENYNIGDNVTEILSVKKYEEIERAGFFGIINGDLHHLVKKTDEIRIQSEPCLLDEIKNKPYYISQKLDGSSVSMWCIDGKFEIGSRNKKIKYDKNSCLWKYAEDNSIIEKLKEYYLKTNKNIVLQGEFCAEGIQKNRLHLKKPEWFIFNVFVGQDMRQLDFCEMVCLLNEFKIRFVPILETGKQFQYETIDELLIKAEGKYDSGEHQEGIVIRPLTPFYSSILDKNFSFKVINNEYLLGGGN